MLFRRLLESALQDLIDAELAGAIGARPHERTESRTNWWNGSRPRTLSTPAGDLELKRCFGNERGGELAVNGTGALRG
jgi:putative transposase